MLYFIQHIRALISSLHFLAVEQGASGQDSVEELVNINTMSQEEIVQFLEKIDINDDGKIIADELTSGQLLTIGKFIDTLGLSSDQINSQGWTVDYLRTRIPEFIAQHKVVTQNTSSESKELKTDIIDYDLLVSKGNIRYGAKGNNVKELQKFLAIDSFYTKGIDGDFQGGTLSALRKYLSSKGFDKKATIAGEVTFGYIKADLFNTSSENKDTTAQQAVTMLEPLDITEDTLTQPEFLTPINQPEETSVVDKKETIQETPVSNEAPIEVKQGSPEALTQYEDVILGFNILTDKSDKIKVVALQTALLGSYPELNLGNFGVDKNGVDGLFGRKTKTALEIAIRDVQKKASLIESYNISQNIGEVNDRIDTTRQEVANLQKKLEVTSELNGKLPDYFFDLNRGYSIEAGLRKLFGDDRYADFIDQAEVDNKEALLNNPENEKKLEKAIMFLSTAYIDNNHGDSSFEDSMSYSGEKAKKHLLKALPWLFGIYLGDIPMPFIKELASGTNINKSVSFKNWIADGMNGEFEDYYDDNKDGVTLLKEQYTLRGMLTSLHLDSKTIEDFDKGGLESLTQETQELIKTYIKVRLIPDLVLMDDESFGFFDAIFDKKEDQADELINKIIELSNQDEVDFDAIQTEVIEFMKLMRKEDDVSANVIEPTENRQVYFNEVDSQNEKIEHISWLSNKSPELFNLSLLFKTEELHQILDFGFSQDQKELLQNVYDAIIDKDESKLNTLLSDGKITSMISQYLLGRHQENLLAQKPSVDNLEYTQLKTSAAHAKSIEGLEGPEAYNQLTSTTTQKGSDIPALWNVYETFVTEAAILGISYEDFGKAVQGGTQVPFSQLDANFKNGIITNTGKGDSSSAITSIAHLETYKGDNAVFKLTPVEKTYTFYADGKEITQTVTYDLYLRPDCSNPLIIPRTINTVSEVQAPEFDPRTHVQVDGKFPAVIPWFVIKKWTGGNGGGGKNPLDGASTPGVDEVATGTGTGSGSGVLVRP